MNYWRIKAVLKDGRVFSNVYIAGSFQLGFPKLSPFKARDIIGFECTPDRTDSGAPVREPNVDVRVFQFCCRTLPRVLRHEALSDLPDLNQRCERVAVPPETPGTYYRCRECGQLWKNEESRDLPAAIDLFKVWSLPAV